MWLGDASGAQRLLVLAEARQVVLADPLRLGGQRFLLLKAVELPGALEGKLDLIRIERVQDDHVVPVETQVVETGQDVVHVDEEVRDHHHERAALHHQRDVVQLLGDGRAGAPASFRAASGRSAG